MRNKIETIFKLTKRSEEVPGPEVVSSPLPAKKQNAPKSPYIEKSKDIGVEKAD